MSSIVVVKFPSDTKSLTLDYIDDLDVGENVTVTTFTVNPSGLTVTLGAASGSTVPVQLDGGSDLHSYGVTVTVNTNLGHVFTRTIAVVINSNIAYDYQNKNVDAFTDVVDTLEAGAAGIGTANFPFPLGFNTSNGQITWELLDRNGIIYSSGYAHSYTATSLSDSVKVEGQAVINCPSDVVPTLNGQVYQIRWKLSVGGQTYYSFESIKITGPTTVPEGVEDVVELVNNPVPVSVVLPQPYDTVSYEVYDQNTRVVNTVVVPRGVQVADGWLYTDVIQGIYLDAKLESYIIVWSYWNSTQGSAFKERQTGRLFVVTPSILGAVDDMRSIVSKSRSTVTGEPDLLFSVPLLIAYLRRGRDYLNGAYGVLTNFTMSNAQGNLREFWLRCSEMLTLRAQYLAEGEKVFNFSGQAISLDVDRTQYYQTMADNIQQTMDQELKPFKQNLLMKGITGGDGNLADNGVSQRPGAAGALGITLTPATGWARWSARFGIRR